MLPFKVFSVVLFLYSRSLSCKLSGGSFHVYAIGHLSLWSIHKALSVRCESFGRKDVKGSSRIQKGALCLNSLPIGYLCVQSASVSPAVGDAL